MITKSDVDRKTQQLKDLDVDRVDGVDKPATGRNFLLFKRGMLTDAILAQEVEQEGDVDPKFAVDALGRSYLDEVHASLGRLNSDPTDMSPIPDAGAGPTLETDTRGITYRPQRFTTTVGGRLVKPTQEYIDNEVGPVKVGDMRLMSPQAAGIATPLDFKAPAPAQVEKRAPGLFTNVVLSPMPGHNRFDAPTVRKDAKPLGDGMFSDVFKGE